MLDLLHSLLVHNDDRPHSGFESLSREARQIYEGARNSEEFRRLEKTVVKVQAEMQPSGTGAAPPRTGANLAQSSRTQNSANSPPNAESRSTNGATVIGRNIDTLRKECGWSLDKLAKETGIDKKLILSHVNKGARPIPRILKEYAQAFSKALGRSIIAPDLEK